LRHKIQSQSQTAKQRAVSGRMITDLEMNGTYRGAVEIFNLCRNLRNNDVLFAECTRTFAYAQLDGRAWLHRLATETTRDDAEEAHWELLVPKTRRPHLRSDKSKPNDLDIYGLRPLEAPWMLLSPYEFYMKWMAVPLLSPYQYLRKGEVSRTEWIGNVKEEIQEGRETAKPGIHYEVISSSQRDEQCGYKAFPAEPQYMYCTFRHMWVLERKPRPEVVCVEGVHMPKASRSATDNSKYCSLFFRPWTLNEGLVQVPHISLLGYKHDDVVSLYEKFESSFKKRRILGKQNTGSEFAPDFVASWNDYIRGHVVTEHAARQAFLVSINGLPPVSRIDEDINVIIANQRLPTSCFDSYCIV
jgi:hypothetical protein